MQTQYNIRQIAAMVIIESIHTGENYLWTNLPADELKDKATAVAAFDIHGTENDKCRLRAMSDDAIEAIKKYSGVPEKICGFTFDHDTSTIVEDTFADYQPRRICRENLEERPAEIPAERFSGITSDQMAYFGVVRPSYFGSLEVLAMADHDTIYCLVGDKVALFGAPVPPQILRMTGLGPVESMFELAVAAYNAPDKFPDITFIDMPFKGDAEGEGFDKGMQVMELLDSAMLLTFRQLHPDQLENMTNDLLAAAAKNEAADETKH